MEGLEVPVCSRCPKAFLDRLVDCGADGALLPAVQTLLVYNSTSQISGRIFSYNQSFRDIGNVTGPLIGASVSANYGFRAVFLVTAGVVLFNAIYSTLSLRRPAADTSHSVN